MSRLTRIIDRILRLTWLFLFLSFLTRNEDSPLDFIIKDQSFDNPLEWYKKEITPSVSYYDCTSEEDNFTITHFNSQPEVIQNYRSFTLENNNHNINSEGGVTLWSVLLDLHFPTMTNLIRIAYLYCLNS